MFAGYRHDPAGLALGLSEFLEDEEKFHPKLQRETFNSSCKGSFWDVPDNSAPRECNGAGSLSGNPSPDHDMPHKYATRARTARPSASSHSSRSQAHLPEIYHEDATVLTAEADAAAEHAEAAVMKAKRSLKRVAAEMHTATQQTSEPGSSEGDDCVRYHTRSADQQPRKTLKPSVDLVPPLSRTSAKGLRHFSMKVCEKVESKGRTTYNEVADELVQELSQADDGDDQFPQYDEKNIRRRVYDALNVLMAMDIIEKEKKEIIWRGLPSFAGNNTDKLQTEKLQKAAELDRKQAHLQDLLEQHRALKKLLSRNQARNPASSGTLLHLPFILVQTKPDATVEIQISEDHMDVQFDFEMPFQLQDDGFVLRHLAARMDDIAEPSHNSHNSTVKHEDIGIYGSPALPQPSLSQDSRRGGAIGGRTPMLPYGSPQISSASKMPMYQAHANRLGLDDTDPSSPAIVAIPHHMSAAGMSAGYLHNNLYAAPGVYAVES